PSYLSEKREPGACPGSPVGISIPPGEPLLAGERSGSRLERPEPNGLGSKLPRVDREHSELAADDRRLCSFHAVSLAGMDLFLQDLLPAGPTRHGPVWSIRRRPAPCDLRHEGVGSSTALVSRRARSTIGVPRCGPRRERGRRCTSSSAWRCC